MDNKNDPLEIGNRLDKTDIEEETVIPFTPLLAAIFGQMATDAANTHNRIEENLLFDNRHLRATLQIIRESITDLANGDYQPTSSAFVRSLYPSKELVNLVMSDFEGIEGNRYIED